MDGNTKWMKFKHPSIYGRASDFFHDQFFYEILKWEFRYFLVDRAAHYVPFTWLRHGKTTKLGIAPYLVCPRLSIIDLNKDKDRKCRRNKGVMPEAHSAMLDLYEETIDYSMLEYYRHMEAVGK